MSDRLFEHKGAVSIGRISYINVSPVYYGLDGSLKPDWLTMVTQPPAVLNRMLEAGDIVMSPVSSAAYAKNHRSWLLMPDVSISSFGKVMSVLLASHYSLDDLDGKTLIFTEESASAANLVRYILARRKIRPKIETRKLSTPETLSGQADAVLVIGDAALTFDWPGSFRHVFDLGRLWDDMTGLPFVYAVWAVRRDFAHEHPHALSELKRLFGASKRMGDDHREDIVTQAVRKTGLNRDTCREYFRHLNCDFTPGHKQGMSSFFEGLYSSGLISDKVVIELA